jgi:HK97 family phage prohead protease
MKAIERRQFDFEARAVHKSGRIDGHAAVFDRLSDDLGGFRERVAPGAFTKAIKTSDARALIDHQSNLVLGRQSSGTLVLRQDDIGLHSIIDAPDTSYAKDLAVLMQRGDVREMSFGFTVQADEWEGLETDSPIRTIVEVGQLFDVSVVTFPAYPDAEASLRSWNIQAAQRSLKNAKEILTRATPGKSRATPAQDMADIPAINFFKKDWTK